MKKFTVVCDFQGGAKSPFDFYIGMPHRDHHPIQFQANWLGSTKGGSVPQDIMDSLKKLYDLSVENNMDFEELCMYAMSSANQEKEDAVEDPTTSEEDDGESDEAEGDAS